MKTNTMLITALLLLTGLSAFSQNYLILVKPASSKTWGYCNLEGQLVIPPKYAKCAGFSADGFAPVYDSKLKEFYLIDTKGEKLETEIKGYQLQEIFSFGLKGFSEGYTAVELGEKWGFMNTAGKLIVPATFEKVIPFHAGFASGMKGGKFYIIDLQGREILVDIPSLEDVNKFSGGLATFKTLDGSVGYINGSGQVVIPAKFFSAGEFVDGIAWAKDKSEKVGYIDARGEWIIEPQFEGGKNYDPAAGLARVKTVEAWAYTNKQGELFYMKGSELLEDFMGGLARGKSEGKFGYFNPKMEWAISPQFDGARDFKNGYACVRIEDLWGVINMKGDWVIKPMFEDIKDVELVK